MKSIYSLLFAILAFSNAYSQSDLLIGKWVLVKTIYADGRNLEINNPQYATKSIVEISKNSIKINSALLSASFSANKMVTPFRSINFTIRDGFLVTQDDGTDKFSYFLKANDFVEKYPEFSLKEIERAGEIVLVDNGLTGYDFKNELTLDDFILKNKKDRNSKDFKNLYFRVEFILTPENQIKDIKVLNSIDQLYDSGYIGALQKASPYFSNNTGKNLLISQEVNQLKWFKDLTDENEKRLFTYSETGLNCFEKNNFEKAITELSKIRELVIVNHRFKTVVKEAMIKLAISYLAVGKNREACEVFNGVGDKTDFEVRNFLLDFCKE